MIMKNCLPLLHGYINEGDKKILREHESIMHGILGKHLLLEDISIC